MSSLKYLHKPILAVVGFIYVFGLAVGGVAFLFRWVFGGDLPDWKWWEYLLAPLVTGAVAIILEGLGEGISHLFGINRPGQPRWKQSMGILVIFVLLTVLVIGPALYKIANE